jgi:hypothetical protein
MMSQIKLSPTEQRVYDLVCQSEVMCRQLSPRDSGAVPGLVQKGLIEVYKKNVSPYRVRKIKFLRKT